MDAYEIVNALNQTYNICDPLDNSGVGAWNLTNGNTKTREALKLELTQFLLYIGNANSSFSEGEQALINLVYGDNWSIFQLKQACATIDEPSPSSSLTLAAFLYGQKAINSQNGSRETSVIDLITNLYDAMGQLMIEFDENAVSKARFNKYMSGMKSYILKNL